MAFSTGPIAIFDIRAGQPLLKLSLPAPLPGSKAPQPTSLSFRTDGVQHHLAVSASSGLIAIFDLDSGPDSTLQPGRLVHKLEAHGAPISRIAYLPGQALLISSAGDNAIKQWYFDAATGPRLLRSRAGHKGALHLVRYYGGDGKAMLTASEDAFRYTSIVRDSRSTEMAGTSKGVGSLAWNKAKARDWDDCVAVSPEGEARSWSVHNKRVGKFSFELGDSKGKRSSKDRVVIKVRSNALSRNRLDPVSSSYRSFRSRPAGTFASLAGLRAPRLECGICSPGRGGGPSSCPPRIRSRVSQAMRSTDRS